MRKFIRGQVGRVLSLVLALLMVPSLLVPFGSIGHAATGGRQNILVLPLSSTADKAPFDLGSRILVELKQALAGKQGVEVNELTPNSPILSAAASKLETEELKSQLKANYEAAMNPATEEQARREAAAALVKELGVDAVVYGTVDQFEFSPAAGRTHRAMVHVTATKITVENDATLATPIIVTGKSDILPDSKGSITTHTNMAVLNLSKNFAALLMGEKIASEEPLETPTIRPDKDTGKKKGTGSAAIVLLLLLAAAAAGAGGGGGHGDGTPVTLEGKAYATSTTVELHLPDVPNLDKVKQYTVTRSGSGSFTRLPANVTTSPNGREIIIVDDGARLGTLYTYTAEVTYGSGSPTDYSFVNAANPTSHLVGAGMPPALGSLTATQVTGSTIRLNWGYVPGAVIPTFIDGFIIQRKRQDQDATAWMQEGQLVAASARSATFTIPSAGVAYEYRIFAHSNQGFTNTTENPPTATITVAAGKPETPTGLQLAEEPFSSVPGSVALRLTWNVPQDTFITGYEIYRLVDGRVRAGLFEGPTGAGGIKTGQTGRQNDSRSHRTATIRQSRALSGTLLATITNRLTTTYLDSSVTDGKEYGYYVVSVADNNGVVNNSDPSGVVSRKVNLAPGEVTNLTVASTTNTSVRLTWTPPTKNADGISDCTDGNKFEIYRSTDAAVGATTVNRAVLLEKFTKIGTRLWSVPEFVDAATPVRSVVTYAVVAYDNVTPTPNNSPGPYPVTQTTIYPAPQRITLTAATNGVVANGPAQQMTITVGDGQNLPIPNVSVVVSCPTNEGAISATGAAATTTSLTVTTNSAGTATAWFIPPTRAPADGQVDVTATVSGTTLRAQWGFRITAPVAQAITLTVQDQELSVVDAAGTHPSLDNTRPSETYITAVVTDPSGIRVQGETVSFVCSDPDAAFPDGDKITTNANGEARVKMRAGYRAGQVTVYGTVKSTITGMATLIFKPGKPFYLLLDTPQSITQEGACSVKVSDKNQNPIQNAIVFVSTTLGSIVPSTTLTTAADGSATFTLKTNGQTGTATVMARTEGISAVTRDVNFAGEANPELITGQKSIVAGTTMAFTWRLKKTDFTALSNVPVKAKVTGGQLTDGTITATELPLTTDVDGKVSFSFIAPAQVGTVTLTFLNTSNAKIGSDEQLLITLPIPTGLTATAVSDHEIDLAWTDVAGDMGYEIQGSLDTVTWTSITTTAMDAVVYIDNNLQPGTSYFYRIRAKITNGDSAWSTVANATTFPAAPAAPQLTVVSMTQINLTWQNIAGETRYIVERSTDQVTWTSPLATTNMDTTSYSDTTCAAGTTYYYRIAAVNGSGRSTSPAASATTVPPAPTGLVAATVSSSQINLTWLNVTGETGYRIDCSLDQLTWRPLGETGVDIVTYAATNLAAGTMYYFRVRAVNAGGLSDWSAIANATTVPVGPTNLVATADSDTQITLNWNNVTGETGYKIERSLNGTNGWNQIGTTTFDVTTFTDTGLTANTIYYYRVAATHTAGDSAWSAVASALTAPPAPTGLTATAVSSTQIRLVWNDVNGESLYQIERRLDSTMTWERVNPTAANIAVYLDNNLTGNTTYHYRVRAVNDSGGASPWSADSATTFATTPPAVGIVVALSGIQTTQLTVSWTINSSINNIARLIVQRSIGDTTNWVNIATLDRSVTTYTDTGLVAGTTYYYRVVAENSANAQTFSDPVSATTIPSAPTGLTATVLSASEVSLAWTDVSGETNYRLERSTDRNTWTEIATTDLNIVNFDDSGLDAGTTYYYRVRAINASGESTWSVIVSAITVPPAPTNLTATVDSESQVTLNWTNVTGETGYTIERSPDGTTGWAEVGTTAANVTTFADTGLTANTGYYYRVAAKHAVANSDWSGTVLAITAPARPGGVSATPNPSISSQITVTWTDVAGEKLYRIERSLNPNDPASWVQVGTTAANVAQFINNGLDANTTYSYRVRSVNAAGAASSWSDIASATTGLASSITVSLRVVSSSAIDVRWTNVDNETGYIVEYSRDLTTWTNIANLQADVTTYSHTGLLAGTTYYYRVTASNSSSSTVSNPVGTTTIPARVTGLTATASASDAIDLTWTDVSGEIGYKIERSATGTSGWAQIGLTDMDVTTYTDTGLTAGTRYYYRVRAYNLSGNALYSTTANATTVTTAPTGLTATAVSGTQINLAWSDVQGETGYEIERSIDQMSWVSLGNTAANITTYSDTTCQEGTTYYYRVRATNVGGNSAWSPVATATTMPPAPTNLVATAISTSLINLSWTDVSGETGYELESSINQTTWQPLGTNGANIVDYAAASLAPGTTYYFRVRATSANGASAWSNVANATTVPPAPLNLTANAISDTQITLTWNNVTGETGYKIERSPNGTSGWAAVNTVATDITTFTDTGLTANTIYYYRVAATHAVTDSAWSNVASALTAPPAPTGLTATANSSTQITLRWTDVSGEALYQIERNLDSTTIWERLSSTSANITVAKDNNLTPGKTYHYRVRAVNDTGGTSLWSDIATATTGPAAPITVTITAVTATQITLSWSAVNNINDYQIQRSPDGTTWANLVTEDIDVTTHQDTGLTPGTLYFYRVIANNAAGGQLISDPVSATTIPPTPTGLTATVISGSEVNLAWTDVSGEMNYELQRSTDRTNWTAVGTNEFNIVTFDDSGLTAGTTYYYRVRATNAAGNSNWSVNVTAITIPPAPTNLTATANSESQVTLDWTNVTGETGYVIQRSPDGTTGWAQAGTTAVNVTTFTDTGLTANTGYYYRVAATHAVANSDWSGTIQVITAPNRPTGVTATANATISSQITVTWNDVAGEALYRIERSTNGTSGWIQVGTTAANVAQFVDNGLTPNTDYYYRVRAVNADGAASSWSDIANATTGLASSITVTLSVVSSSAIDVSWNDVDNETSYLLEVSQDLTTWTTVATLQANVTTYSHTGLLAGTTYYYRVTARNSSSSTVSSPVGATTTPARVTTLTAMASASDAIDLTWSDVSGEIGYKIERSATGTSGWAQVGTADMDVTTYTDTGLTAGTRYYYRVRAYNLSGNAQYSPTANATTIADGPTSLTAVAVSGTQINLTWNNVLGETGYEVQRSIDQTNWVTIGTTAVDVVTYSDRSCVEGTTYYYHVRAVNTGGNSAWSPMASATTLIVRPIARYDLTTAIDRIYFSADPDDQLADSTPTVTELTLTGYDANNQPAVGATVQLSTDKGTFGIKTPDQSLSGDLKTITGILDTDGKMYVNFRGRVDDNNPLGNITLPTTSELGQPTLRAVNSEVTTTLGGNRPFLVGPPYRIILALNVPTPPVVQEGTVPVLFQTDTANLTGTVTDLSGQRVLANMPVWFAQGWQRLTDPSIAIPENAYTEYYNLAFGPANMGNVFSQTNSQGIAQASFTGNHSGLYTVHAFALRKEFNRAAMTLMTNLNETDSSNYNIYLLPSSMIGSDQYVTTNKQLVNKTLVEYYHWSQLVNTYPRIKYDGTMTTRLVYTATDQDNKKVLPNVPFHVQSSISKLIYDNTTDREILPTDILAFNERSEAAFLLRGIGITGFAGLNFDSMTGSSSNSHSTYSRVVTLFSPRLEEANFAISADNPLDPARIAGIDQVGAGLDTDATFTVHVYDNSGNDYPDGLQVELLDSINGAAPQQWIITSLLNGQATFTIDEETLGALDIEHHEYTVRISGSTIDTDNASFTSDTVYHMAVTKPISADVSLTTPVAVALGSNIDLTSLIADGDGTSCLPGFTIRYEEANTQQVVTTTNTTAAGRADVSIPAGNTPRTTYYTITYVDANNRRQVLGRTSDIYIGAANSVVVVAPTVTDIPANNANQGLNFQLQTGGQPVASGYPISIQVVNAPAGFTLNSSSSTVGALGAININVSTGAGAGVATLNIYDASPLTPRLAATITLNVYGPPIAPTGLVAVGGAKQIVLTWNDMSNNETNFVIERSNNGNLFYQQAIIAGGAAATATYTDANLPDGTTYWYRVRARNRAGDSDPTNIYGAKTNDAPPPTP